jgi:serine phosphatase RsbU (regulator of sigma subunit)
MLAFSFQEISYSTLANLIGISVYLALGGQIPLMGSTLSEWVPAFVAIVVNAFTPAVILLPVIVQINRIANIPNTWHSLRSFILTVVGVLLVTTPFSIPFALLYSNVSPLASLFAVFGLVVVNLLLYYLSRINQHSRQRTREMTQLEALGEEIIQAPPDGSTLRELLAKHVSVMFQDAGDILEIRIFKDVALPGFAGNIETLHFIHPPHHSPAPDHYWEQLEKTSEPHLVFNDVIPAGTKAIYGDAIIDKITSAAPTENDQEPVCIGGVYLLRHKSVAKTIDALPAVQALASQVASALYRAQIHAETLAAHKMTQELEFAGSIQASFLPENVPEIPGWGIAASLTPARQTAGDFYDFIPLGDDRLGIVVADVADKGTGAALYMALSRTLLRTYAMQFPDDPAEALRQTNERILADTRANQFVTVFYGVVDLSTGEMLYCNAGHNPAFLVRINHPEQHEAFIRTGPPLGIFGDLVWEEGSAKINAGDVLLLYSDGVNEAQNLDEEFYEYDRLLDQAKSNFDLNAEAIHNAVIESLGKFVGAAPQVDDITLMVLKRE